MAVPQYELEPKDKLPIYKMMNFVNVLTEINQMSVLNLQTMHKLENQDKEDNPYLHSHESGLIKKVDAALKDESDGIVVSIEILPDSTPSFRIELDASIREVDQPEVIIATVNRSEKPGLSATNLKFEGPTATSEYQLLDGVQIKEMDSRLADLLDKKIRRICKSIGLDVNTSGPYSLVSDELPLSILNHNFLNALLDYSATNVTSMMDLLDNTYNSQGQNIEMYEKFGSNKDGEFVEYYYKELSYLTSNDEDPEDLFEDVGGLKVPTEPKDKTRSMFVSAVSTLRLSLNSDLLGGHNIKHNRPTHFKRIDPSMQNAFLLNEIKPENRKQLLERRHIDGTKDILRSSYTVFVVDQQHEQIEGEVVIDNPDGTERSEYQHNQSIYAQEFKNEEDDYSIKPYTKAQKANIIRALFLGPDSY